MLGRTVLAGITVVSMVSACNKENQGPEVIDNPQEAVWKLNKNVEGLKDLAAGIVAADSVAIFSIQYNEDGSVLYRLNLKDGGDVDLYSEIVTHKIIVPELSMNKVGDVFYWTVNGSFLTDRTGNRIAVADESMPISFDLQDETIVCKIRESIIGEYPMTKADYLARDVALDYDLDAALFKLRLSSGYNSFLPTVSGFQLLKENVQNRSFYKDVFLDAGIELTSRKSLAAVSYLGLSLEGINFSRSGASSEEIDLQNDILSGCSEDTNGRLLYPDGQPRYRLLFVNGGSAGRHGKSLGDEGLEKMRTFVNNGGSYVGTCAGAFFASKGTGGKISPYYLSVWPGFMAQTGLKNVYTGMIIEKDSPLLKYYDFGGDHYVDSVRHNGGGYPNDYPLGTEVLARFDYPDKVSVHKQPCLWAYKASPQSGRVIQEGSHPEEVSSGERRDLTAAMIQYAMDGCGVVTLKGFLKNGISRAMEKNSSDCEPEFTKIGDLQTHHFASYIPSDAQNVTVEISSSFSGCNLALMMSQDSYAFSDAAEFIANIPGAKQKLFFPSIREGVWYIAVQCLTTVSVEQTDYGQAYTGNTEVLNGVPYYISVSWD